MLYNELQIKGLSTELECERKFIELGFIVSVPYGNNARYDFLVDTGKRIFRMQAKTSHNRKNSKGIVLDNSFTIRCTNTISNTKGTKRKHYVKEDVDFIVSLIKGVLVIIPVEEIENCDVITMQTEYIPLNKNQFSLKFLTEYTIEEKFIPLLDEEELPEIFNPLKNLQNNLNPKNVCPICGEPKSLNASMCNNCRNKINQSHLKNRITREELKDKIRNLPFTEIGKEFNITDNAIRRWCEHYNLPYTKKAINSYTDEEWANL